MVKGIYQLPPRTRMKLIIHSNIWWFARLELIDNGFSYFKTHNLYRKGIQYVDDTWDSEHQTFLSWDKAHEKFNLTSIETGDCTILKYDQNSLTMATFFGSRLGYHQPWTMDWVYKDRAEDPIFVLQCLTIFTSPFMCLHHLFMPIRVQCFMVGTHSRWLSE